MVAQGWLCHLTAKSTAERLNVSGVPSRGGEFAPGELELAVNRADTNVAIVPEIVLKGADRKSWIVFCAGATHAEAITVLLKFRGIGAGLILGDTPKTGHEMMIAEHRLGEIRELVSCGVLTTGFDSPRTDLICAFGQRNRRDYGCKCWAAGCVCRQARQIVWFAILRATSGR